LHTQIGALKNDKKNNGMALITNFMRQALLAKDKYLPFQTGSFFLIFYITGSQKEHLDGLPPPGRPK